MSNISNTYESFSCLLYLNNQAIHFPSPPPLPKIICNIKLFYLPVTVIFFFETKCLLYTFKPFLFYNIINLKEFLPYLKISRSIHVIFVLQNDVTTLCYRNIRYMSTSLRLCITLSQSLIHMYFDLLYDQRRVNVISSRLNLPIVAKNTSLSFNRKKMESGYVFTK